jgi:hypothetical protein
VPAGPDSNSSSCRRLDPIFGAFSALGRHETIARLDGVAVNTPIHPEVTAAAIDRARHALGADRYDELERQGSGMTIDDLAAFLIAAIADP